MDRNFSCPVLSRLFGTVFVYGRQYQMPEMIFQMSFFSEKKIGLFLIHITKKHPFGCLMAVLLKKLQDIFNNSIFFKF